MVYDWLAVALNKLVEKETLERSWREKLPSGMPREPSGPRDVGGICSLGDESGNACHDERGRLTNAANAVPPKPDERSQGKRESTARARQREGEEQHGAPPAGAPVRPAELSPSERAKRDVAEANFLRFRVVRETSPFASPEASDRFSEPKVTFSSRRDPDSGQSLTISEKDYNIKNAFGEFQATFVAQLAASNDEEQSITITDDLAARYATGEVEPEWRLATEAETMTGVRFKSIKNGDIDISYWAMYDDSTNTWAGGKSSPGRTTYLEGAYSSFASIHEAITNDAVQTINNWRQAAPELDADKMKEVYALDADVHSISTAFLQSHDAFTEAQQRLTDLTHQLGDTATSGEPQNARVLSEVQETAKHVTALEDERDARLAALRAARRKSETALREAQKPVVDYLRTISYIPSSDHERALHRFEAEAAALGLTDSRLKVGTRGLWLNTLLDLNGGPSEDRDAIRNNGRASIMALPDVPSDKKEEWAASLSATLNITNPSLLRHEPLGSVRYSVAAEKKADASSSTIANTITLGPDTEGAVLAHEIGHHLAGRNSLLEERMQSWVLLRAQTTGEEKPTQMKQYSEGTIGFKDNLAEEYIGRYYPQAPGVKIPEPLAIGIEALLSEKTYYACKSDIEHLKLTFASLRGM